MKTNMLFPTLRGAGWGVERSPEFNNEITQTNAGIEIRTTSQSAPRWRFKINYNFLKEQETTFSEFGELKAFFVVMQGTLSNFLFRDPNNYQITDGYIATGDSTETKFHLSCNYKGYQEKVTYVNLVAEVVITVNGVPLSNTLYTVLESGELEFETAPADGSVIKATFEHYYRVRFAMGITFNEFLYKLHKSSVELISVLGE